MYHVDLHSFGQYYKDELLSQNFIQSNMQFTLSWKGHEYEKESVTLHFSGMEPENVTIYTSSSKFHDKNAQIILSFQLKMMTKIMEYMWVSIKADLQYNRPDSMR